MIEGTDDTQSENSDAAIAFQGEDYEAKFLREMSEKLDKMGDDDGVQEEEETDETEQVEGDEVTEEEETEEVEEEESEDKVSIRINGKKAAVEDLLEKTQHIVKIDGEESEVPYKELIAGYQRGADYANKTSDLKQQKEQIRPYMQMVAHAQEDPQFAQYIQSYFQNGPYPEAATNPLLKVSDEQLSDLLDPDSSNHNPSKAGEVVKARKDWQSKQAERQIVTQKVQQRMTAQFNEWAQGEIEKARNEITQLGGDYEADGKDVLSHLAEAGFSEQEINGLVDARMTRIAWEAAQYQKLRNQMEAPKVRIGKKRVNAPSPRPMATGTPRSESVKRHKSTDAYRKAAQTQSTDDWVAAISQRLNRR